MFTVTSPFVLNGKSFEVGDLVDGSKLEADDRADLLSRGVLVDPEASKKPDKKIVKEKVEDASVG